MIYSPRKTILNGKEVLVKDDELVGYREQLGHENRILIFSGKIDGTRDIHDLLLSMDTLSHKPIKIFIASGGGELDMAYMIYDTMKMIQSPIFTIGRYCASAAVMLLAAGSKRYLQPHANIMLHLPSGKFEGDSEELRIQNKLMEGYRDTMVNILRECGVKKTKEEILIDINRQFWMTPQEAIDYGLADEIITPEIWAGFLK